jgi:hypothetical protein
LWSVLSGHRDSSEFTLPIQKAMTGTIKTTIKKAREYVTTGAAFNREVRGEINKEKTSSKGTRAPILAMSARAHLPTRQAPRFHQQPRQLVS